MSCSKSNNCMNYSDTTCKICKNSSLLILDDFYVPIVKLPIESELNVKMDSVYDLSRDELEDVVQSYDEYIQDANENDYYSDGWRPVSIQEYYDNEYKEILEGDL